MVSYVQKHVPYTLELHINSLLGRGTPTRKKEAKAFDVVQILMIHISQAARPGNYERYLLGGLV